MADPGERHRVSDGVKRGLDIALAVVGLIVTAPVLIVVAALIARRLGRPVLFRQVRPGLGGKSFRLVKFRTMRPVDRDAGLVSDAERLTPFGARLRRTSLDELPTLWNVLRGDMSLVGPRPLLMRYLDIYTVEQARRHEVRPGVTGLAQVRGRNALSWTARLAADVEYIDNRSLRLDLSILGATVVTVLRRTGVSADGSVTMPEFTGTESGHRSVTR